MGAHYWYDEAPTRKHGSWLFQYPRPRPRLYLGSSSSSSSSSKVEQAEAIWSSIPPTTDILVTHGPPLAHLDLDRHGCHALLSALWCVRPQLQHIYTQADVRSCSSVQIKQAPLGLRALRSASISKSDWHSDQILCLPTKESWEIVFIDFAFAYLDVGSDNGSLTVGDWALLSCLLREQPEISEDMMKEYWTPPLEYEF